MAAVAIVPEYWGSILQGEADRAAKYDSAYGKPCSRLHSMAMVMEPFLTPLCRKAGVFCLKQDVFVEMRKALYQFLDMIAQPLAGLKVSGTGGGEDEITFENVKTVCQSLGITILGSEECFYLPELVAAKAEAEPVTLAATAAGMDEEIPTMIVDHIATLGKFMENDLLIIVGKMWDVFMNALTRPSPEVIAAHMILKMSNLVFQHRATAAEPLGGQSDVIYKICFTFHSETRPMREILTFLGAGCGKKLVGRALGSCVLFDTNDCMEENWVEEVCHKTLRDAINAGVDVVNACDRRSGITLLHAFACKCQDKDCRELIEEMGFEDVNRTNGHSFENGDGWGELEYVKFTALNFACANGAYETAKVLLRNGANPNHRAGWDGGCHIPCTKQAHGDYWYTNGNTPLHQAARGNHVDVIHLLLKGPDKESLAYAKAKGIDLMRNDKWGRVNINDSSAFTEVFDENNNKDEILNLTPLDMAIIFGNVESAVLLHKFGAKCSEVTHSSTFARAFIMRNLMNANDGEFIRMRKHIMNNIDAADDADAKESFLKFLSNPTHDDVVQEWDKDGYNDKAVPTGDIRVRSSDEEDNEYQAGFLSVEQCRFTAGIKNSFQAVLPSMQASRNLQSVLSNVCEMIIRRLMIQLSLTDVTVLKKKALLKALPAFLPEEVFRFGLRTLEKDGDESEFGPFIAPVRTILTMQYGRVTCEEDGIVGIAMLLNFIMCETLELSAGVSRGELHLEMVSPWSMMHLHDELDPLFDYCVAVNTIRSSAARKVPYEFQRYACSAEDNPKEHDTLHPSWATRSLAKDGLTSEAKLIDRENKYYADNYPNGPMISVHAFNQLLQQALVGLKMSPKAALVVQLSCEMLLITMMTKASATAHARSEPKYEKYNRMMKKYENPEEGVEEELSGTDLDLCAADVQGGFVQVMQDLEDIRSMKYFFKTSEMEDEDEESD